MAARWDQVRLAVMLLTRLPMGRLADPAPPLRAAAWAYPVAGLIAALPPALVFWAAGCLPPAMAALLALAMGALVTGGLHEDGLADVADGFGGGATRDRKLEIMKDSRIGSHGALALLISVGLRASGLAAAPDTVTGMAALIGLGAASRAGLPWIMYSQPTARPGGLGASAGGVSAASAAVAVVLGVLAALVTGHGLVVLVAMAIAGLVFVLICRRQIGGYTGDTLGATQQITEIAGWIVLAALWT